MKKFFTLLFMALPALSGMADTYNGPLVVTVDGSSTSQTTDITVDRQDDGNYTLSLMNFKLKMGITTMNVGNIIITDVPAVSNGQTSMLKVSKNIKITGGTMDVFLKNVPINMTGELRDGDFYTNIDIVMKVGSKTQTINVQFGEKRYQLPNAGFETFHTATLTQPADPDDPDAELAQVTSDEPDNWHSFMSASCPEGMESLVWLAGYNAVTFKSSDVRPGSTGKQSVMLKSIDMMGPGYIANGTITTGRMNTGSMMAADTNSNYAWSDLATTDKDDHGDPFYSVIYSRPDAMKVWVKYTQEAPSADYPYATATALLNDGTRFQEPAPAETVYTNVVGEARNPKIADTNGEWKELTIPFVYDDFKANGAVAKSVLVTFSTNAAPGQGSHNDAYTASDILYVDDMSFVYNAGLAAVSFTAADGEVYLLDGVSTDKKEYSATLPFDVTADNFKAMSDGQGAYVSTTIADGVATIEITSNDLLTTNTYKVNIAKGNAGGVTSGIDGTVADTDTTASAIFTLDGKRVNAMTKGGIYIVKMANGSVKKVIKK